jgi:hypothetical protein
MVSMENDPNEKIDKSDFPVFSIRNLAGTPSQLPTSSSQQQQPLFQSKYPIEYMNYDHTLINDNFHMKIIYSFKHHGYVYFLFTITNRIILSQSSCNNVVTSPANNRTQSTIVTRMLRICETSWNEVNKNNNNNNNNNNNDLTSFFSSAATNLATLTEIIIDCEDELNNKYHLLQSASFHATENSDSSQLFMIFNSSEPLAPTAPPKSALCSLKIKDINQKFNKMLLNCLEGKNELAEPVSPYSNKNTWKTPCRCSMIDTYYWRSTASNNITDEEMRSLFCRNDYFNYMNGKHPLTLKSIDIIDKKSIFAMTCINLVPIDSKSIVLIIATSEATIIQAKYNIQTNEAFIYDKQSLLDDFFNENERPKLDETAVNSIQLTIVNKQLFASYNNYLFQISLDNCQRFKDCASCIGGINNKGANPFCGWCVYEQKCSSYCKTSLFIPSNTEKAINSKVSTCPMIKEIKPSAFINPKMDSFQSQMVSFELNLNLQSNHYYYCSNQQGTIKIEAKLVNPTTIECNLKPIKQKLQLNDEIFNNITIDLKVDSSVLLATAHLHSFNCNNFKYCSQCLNPALMPLGSCVWCSRNSKCIFNDNNYEKFKSCPSEIHFFDTKTSKNNQKCTSFSIETTRNDKNKLEIAFSDTKNMGKLPATQLMLKNIHSSYQLRFKCVFSTNQSQLLPSQLDDTSTSNSLFTSEVISLSKLNSNDEFRQPFDCLYSPYQHIKQSNHKLPSQTVYMSIWWTNELPSFNSNDAKWKQIEISNNYHNSIEINIINCEVEASSCGKCISDHRLVGLGCGWCENESKCTLKKDCSSQNWMNRLRNDATTLSYCSKPKILKMEPECGPFSYAGTRIRIYGENLGHSSKDIKVKMRPSSIISKLNSNSDLECKIIDHLYKETEEIVCETQPVLSNSQSALIKSPINRDYSLYVETNILSSNSYSSFNETSPFIFRYITPQVESIEPKSCLRSGGDLIKIKGKHLLCGSTLKFLMPMGGGECLITNSTTNFNFDTILCQCPQQKLQQIDDISDKIELKMDNYIKILNESKFEFIYLNDPRPLTQHRTKMIQTGGLDLHIKGQDFNNIQNKVDLILSTMPMIQDDNNNKIFKSTCKIINAQHLNCKTPSINDENIKKLFIYFKFNEMGPFFQLKSTERHFIHVHSDPSFKLNQFFTDKQKIIIIQGKNLLKGIDENCYKNDYKVWIGDNYQCNITMITNDMITCIVPEKMTLKKELKKKRQLLLSLNSIDSKSALDIRVEIGEIFTRTIGVFQYEADLIASGITGSVDGRQIRIIIVAACFVTLVLLCVIIGCFVILKRRQSKQVHQLKRMQTEFENLEMRVARECKEAFTELQMDIGELANTLNQTGAPFLDFQSYSMKILFPNANQTDKYFMTCLTADLRLSMDSTFKEVYHFYYIQIPLK